MDDAQQIVLVALQQAGIQVPDSARAATELNSTALVAICAQAVNSLNAGAPALPTVLPSGTAERFRVCTDLAGAVKVLGYRGDLSFHQFLYPSHKDTHKLLRFLLDKLSKSSSSSSQGGRGRKARAGVLASGGASTRVSGVVREALTRAYGDAHTAEGSGEVGRESLRFQSSVLRTSSVKTVEGVRQVKPTLVTLKAKARHTILPSLLELNARSVIGAGADSEVERGSGDGTLISHGEFLPRQLAVSVSDQSCLFDGSESHVNGGEDGGGGRDGKAVALLQEQVDELVSQADRMEAEARAMEDRVSVLKEEHEAKEGEIRQVEGEMAVLREGVSLALDSSKSSPDEALGELQEQVVQGEQHMAALQAEWEAVRRPLEEKKAELEKDIITGEGELASKTRKLKEIRQQLQQSTEKLRVREEQAWTLETDLKEISSRPKRSSYVHRITELVKNSLKQETDIAKIISDTRALQRDSNSTNDRLRRTYALVDELVFRDAKKDPVCRQSYRQLTTIHETFADIVDKVLEMDKTGRDIAELQAQLEELQKSSLDVQSVQADLDAVAIETRALERRLALVQASTHRTIPLTA
ncbi:hypothetical protein KC19_3G250900 [Ceratodon purpureus]|uniref:Coiled-coil domain-containing protein 22 homolog n=1 Tax=Ceratodon purpureus TaxID=3225 RepID=A0A8T0IQ88_CERPU|nr:hypothetical protein KC19_3G250900 [Ceratodon purpureus]